MKHFFDHRTQTAYEVWHKDPRLEATLRLIIETIRPTCFVETGTHMGWASAWLAENFPWLPIYTVEVDADFAAKSADNLAQYKNVTLKHMSSVQFLQELMPVISQGTPMFWLDAHWWPPEPLRDECAIVASLPKYVAIIDDFWCKNPDFRGDTFNHMQDPVCLSYVADILGPRCWRPNYEAPPSAKGYGMFLKNVPYTPPSTMKEDVLP